MSDRELQQLLAANPDLVVADDPGAATAAQLARVIAPPARAPSEHDEQAALFAWAAANEAAHPELCMLAAVPNGGYRPQSTAARLKAEGVRAGYPDVLLDVPRGRFHGLRIELKRADRANHATPAQGAWIERLRYYGYCAIVAYGAQEAIGAIQAYLSQDGGR